MRGGVQSWLIFAAMAAVAGCSAILTFNPDGQPCDTADRLGCLAGYSCLVTDPSITDTDIANPNNIDPSTTACVSDQSITEGQMCLLDRQCEGDLICPTPLRRCARSCPLSSALVPAAGCKASEYCKPFYSVAMYSDAQSHTQQQVAACVPSENCTLGQSCTSNTVQGGICAQMTPQATACVTGCEITYMSTNYSDNCRTTSGGSASYCQPVPVTATGEGTQVLACLPINPAVQSIGGACGNGVATTCPSGSGCINGVCAAYCRLSTQTGSACAAGFTCCDLHLYSGSSTSNKIVGYCSSDANCG